MFHCFVHRVALGMLDSAAQLLKNTNLSVLAYWFGCIGWELLLLAAASEFQSFLPMALRNIVGAAHGDFVQEYRISSGFMDTTLSMHSGGMVLRKMIAFDLVWKNLNPFVEHDPYRPNTLHLDKLSTFACKQRISAESGRLRLAQSNFASWDLRL